MFFPIHFFGSNFQSKLTQEINKLILEKMDIKHPYAVYNNTANIMNNVVIDLDTYVPFECSSNNPVNNEYFSELDSPENFFYYELNFPYQKKIIIKMNIYHSRR